MFVCTSTAPGAIQGHGRRHVNDNNCCVTAACLPPPAQHLACSCVAGKTETFSSTVTDKFLQLQPIMRNLTAGLQEVAANSSAAETQNLAAVAKLEKLVGGLEVLHQQATRELRADLNQKHKLSSEQCTLITDKLERKVLDNLEKLDGKDKRLETETKDAISSLKVGLKSLTRKMDEDRDRLDTMKNFQSDVKTNLDLIKNEINRSVDVLTTAMEKNVTESIELVQREVSSAL